MNDTPRPTRPVLGLFLSVALATVLVARPAAALDIANTPLSIPTPLAPNIVLTLDDSGSMANAYIPDSIFGDRATRRFKSAKFNSLYYNPDVQYLQPPGTAATSFTNAWANGFYPTHGSIDLSIGYRPTVEYNPASAVATCLTGQDFADHYAGSVPIDGFPDKTSCVAAYYYVFNAGNTDCDRTTADDDCYTKVVVGATSGPGGTDERQNFANWYSFYRTRNLTTVTAAARAFSSVRDSDRVAWQALNSCNTFGTGCSGWDGIDVTNQIRTFQNNKSDFFSWLFRLRASGDTPLRSAMQRAGEYFKTAGQDSPYDNALGDNSNDTEYACRPNFHIVMTDGMWTAAGEVLTAPGNADNTAVTLPDTEVYTPAAPFMDANTDVLADLAFEYWATDLRGDLANSLIPYNPNGSGYWNPEQNDPATWQHMVNFTVGLGLSGSLDSNWTGDTYAGAYATGTSAWPAITNVPAPGIFGPGPEDPDKVYDLWHAALNSRGQFFSADNPDGLNTAFASILGQIADLSASSTALAASSSRLDTGTMIFQAKFDSGDWSGSLSALSVNENTGQVAGQIWTATIPAAGSRSIYTSACSSGTGCAFSWADLSASAQTALGNANVTNYLRGDQSGEQQNGGNYRNRSSLLGDVINADPAYVGAYDYGYVTLSEGGSAYSTFVNNNKTRTRMLYVGANDGMLHAFRADSGHADSGKELFAYVPGAVIPNLALLSDPAYTHRYYVDGAPYVGDAYLGGAWKTLLLGTTGAGGRAVFALDVTDPDNFDATKVLWEFTSATDADLGYTLGQPVIARMKDGNWYAVFGNGYNSANGHAVLFIVNLADGTVAKEFDVGGTDNGLATPALYDADGDRITDAIYAGDNEGNVWKFDVSDADPNNWGVAYIGVPLFSARDASGNAQPITAPLELGDAPGGYLGVMVFFGTGRYFAVGDNTGTAVQSLYGILDSGSAVGVTDRSTLQQQTILYQGAFGGASVRATSNSTVDYNTLDGWYLDLLTPGSPPSAQGERVVSTPLLRHGRVIYTTLIPSSDPCAGGGDSWIMELDAKSGSRLDYSVFDLDGDDAFDSADYVDIGGGVWVPVSGLKSEVGIIKSPTVVTGAVMEYKYTGGAGGIGVTPEQMGGVLTGRVSWREILD